VLIAAQVAYVVHDKRKPTEENEMTFPVLIEEFVGPKGRGHAMILMREDGAFEGLILRTERAAQLDHACWEHRIEDYEVCAVSETLLPVEEMINEELGL
jgi:hypothetical protein